MVKFNLTLANYLLHIPSTVKYTFTGKSRDAYSYIEHFYVSNIPANLVHSIKDIDSNENFSDHILIVLTLDKCIFDLCKQNVNAESRHKINTMDKSNIYENVLLDWENLSKRDYYDLTRIEMNNLYNLLLNSD